MARQEDRARVLRSRYKQEASRQWRFSVPGSAERAILERDIVNTAGVLGHYVGDAANPHHATMHYNGWASAENPNHYATDCGTHSRFEAVFIAHAPRGHALSPYLNQGELAVLYCFILLYLVFAGPGAWSLDARAGSTVRERAASRRP